MATAFTISRSHQQGATAMDVISSIGNPAARWPRRLITTALLAVFALLASCGLTPPPAQAAQGRAAADTTIVNADAVGHQISRFDVDGNSLDAHDGSVLKVGNLYYLYGTSYACGYEYRKNANFCGFKVYSSPDMTSWTDKGFIVAPHSCAYCFRPHVIYNAKTKDYVLWSDGGGVYNVYTNSSPTGLFTQQPTPTLAVGGAVDLSLFEDDNGDAYLIHNTTMVAPGLTADGVVEKLTPDYLSTTGEFTKFGLGDVEAFTVFKRAGVYHALMSDPSCAYCSGGTGEMTATSMLGPWSGAWYDPNGVHQSGSAEPRYRARLVNDTSCGGQPLAAFPVAQDDNSKQYYFMSDRWDNRRANESTANLFIGPMTFDANGVLQSIECVNSFTAKLPGAGGAANVSPTQDQSSGADGFRHYCDVAGAVERQQSFTPSRSGTLNAASITAFQWETNAPLVIDVVDAANGAVLSSESAATVPWAPHVMTVHPQIKVVSEHGYTVRIHSATTTGCYGFEYNDGNPYAGGNESYSTNTGASFTAETTRDLKFTTAVGDTALLRADELPAGYTSCASEGGTCTFSGAAVVAYGAGSYAFRTVAGSTDCGNSGFGGDPAPDVLKSCYVAPAGGPSGYTWCAQENGFCSFTGTRVVAYGVNGALMYQLATNGKSCDYVTFGDDPLWGVEKSCYLAPTSAPPAGWTQCATENTTCSVGGTQTVAFGANGSFITRPVTASTGCTSTEFGTDPAYSVLKACYVRTGPPSGYSTFCAAESGTCSFSGFRTVAYGAGGDFTYRSFSDGTACGTAAFGGDPIVGVAKSCYLTP
jgi:hypothetical protein